MRRAPRLVPSPGNGNGKEEERLGNPLLVVVVVVGICFPAERSPMARVNRLAVPSLLATRLPIGLLGHRPPADGNSVRCALLPSPAGLGGPACASGILP